MTTITSTDTALQTPFDDAGFDEAQLAAASFLARYSGRTLEAYRQDLRGFFQWAADHDVPVLAATRPHIELWRGSMEDRGFAASTIDRRRSTVCGYYRFAHIDGRIRSNPAEYVRRPQVHPSDARRLDRTELGMFLAAADHYDAAHQALAVLLGLNGLRVSEACETNIEDLAVERGHRILRITGKGNKPATIPSCREPHARSTWPSVNATKARSFAAGMGNASTGALRTGGWPRSASAPAGTSRRMSHAHMSARRGRSSPVQSARRYYQATPKDAASSRASSPTPGPTTESINPNPHSGWTDQRDPRNVDVPGEQCASMVDEKGTDLAGVTMQA